MWELGIDLSSCVRVLVLGVRRGWIGERAIRSRYLCFRLVLWLYFSLLVGRESVSLGAASPRERSGYGRGLL